MVVEDTEYPRNNPKLFSEAKGAGIRSQLTRKPSTALQKSPSRQPPYYLHSAAISHRCTRQPHVQQNFEGG